jgi:signal transduction histidine kinase
LALARKIVEMHGGTVRATSGGTNQGSEFVVDLPLQKPAAKAVLAKV